MAAGGGVLAVRWASGSLAGRGSGQADAGAAGRGGRRGVRLASTGGQGGESAEGGGELAGPGPAVREAQDGLAGVEGEPSCGVQQPVAQPLGLAARELAGQRERLGVEEDVLGGQGEFEPDSVGVEVAEREVLKAAVL